MIRPIIVSGASGCGKSTILKKAFDEHPDTFAFSVSHTTRGPRSGEKDGVHYHFVDRDSMKEMIERGELFEHAEFGGNIYGTSKKAVSDIQNSGRICVLDVELQGVRNFKKCGSDAKYILIKAPTLQHLEARLRGRGTETEDCISRRLERAKQDDLEIAQEPHLFDYIIVNDEFNQAYAEFMESIADELKSFQEKHKSNTSANNASSTS